MPTQALQAAAQASSDNHWIAIAISLGSLVVSLTSVYVALRNNWFNTREASKRAVAQFMDYVREAYDLALYNFSGQEISNKREKHFHLLGAEFLAGLEMIGKTEQIELEILELYKKYSQILEAGTTDKKMKPDDLFKIMTEIKEKCLWMIRAYTFRVYIGNLLFNHK